MHEWVHLNPVNGDTISNPSRDQLALALRQLFADPDSEHPDTWINCGSDDGPLYNLSVYSSGYATYTKYADVDMCDELESSRIHDLDVDTALALWENLIAGEAPKPST